MKNNYENPRTCCTQALQIDELEDVRTSLKIQLYFWDHLNALSNFHYTFLKYITYIDAVVQNKVGLFDHPQQWKIGLSEVHAQAVATYVSTIDV